MFKVIERKDGFYTLEMECWTDSIRTKQGEEFSYAERLTLEQLNELETQICALRKKSQELCEIKRMMA